MFQCVDCGKEIPTRGAKRCQSCSSKDVWKRKRLGCYEKPHKTCIDCGVDISRKAIRCRSCSSKLVWSDEDRLKHASEKGKALWEEGILGTAEQLAKNSKTHKRQWEKLKKEQPEEYKRRIKQLIAISRDAHERGCYDHLGQTKEERKRLSKQAKDAWARGCYKTHFTQEFRDKKSQERKEAWARGCYDGVFNTQSNLELDVCEILDQFNVTYIDQYRIPNTSYPYDIFLPNLNLLIEVDGEYWHHSEWAKEQRAPERDARKNALAEKHGYSLIRLREKDIEELGIIELLVKHEIITRQFILWELFDEHQTQT